MLSAALFAVIAVPQRSVNVPSKPMPAYQSFVQNWNDESRPVLAAYMTMEDHWFHVMSPAAVMAKEQRFAPDPGFFTKNGVLLVARVVPDGTPDLKFQGLSEKGGTLEFRYQYTPAKKPGSFNYTTFIGREVTKKAGWTKVRFFENGKLVSEIDVKGGFFRNP